jgi:hypothetical protein
MQMRRFQELVACGLLLVVPAVCQSGRSARRSAASSSRPAPAASDQQALPTFRGIVRGVGRKVLLIEKSDTNTLEFYCSRKTRYYDGSRQVRVSRVKPGDRVSVDAKLGPDGELEAVNVRLDRQEHP